MGSDVQLAGATANSGYFNPRSPDGERPASQRRLLPDLQHFNPRSPDGERPDLRAELLALIHISIHAPRMGSDDFRHRHPQVKNISIHAPRMGSDWEARPRHGQPDSFQSTLPGWGATFTALHSAMGPLFQSTLPGWGATTTMGGDNITLAFQSTLPGWGATLPALRYAQPDRRFQSTLPGWGATGRHGPATVVRRISIHAPRMGSDVPAMTGFTPWMVISIHAPRMGSDRDHHTQRLLRRHFNPRSPDGERPVPSFRVIMCSLFQSTLPGWGATSATLRRQDVVAIFQSTLPGWGATMRRGYGLGCWRNFNPRSPDGERP